MDPQQFRKQIPRVSRFDYGQNQLNIKFKIAFSTIHYDGVNKKYVPDNCIELEFIIDRHARDLLHK
ncbi:MAG: hypothetical protein WB988_07395 [Candidatus Nitrosopolaris sp.]|jgi:hypothetical protein